MSDLFDDNGWDTESSLFEPAHIAPVRPIESEPEIEDVPLDRVYELEVELMRLRHQLHSSRLTNMRLRRRLTSSRN